MKNHPQYTYFTVVVICLVLGFVLGCYIRPAIINYQVNHKKFDINDSELLSDSLCNLITKQGICLTDTLAKKDRNLLVFWSPTCRFSKQFFKHELNDQIVGIYCIPITDDLDYLKYYIENNNISLPQLMLRNNGDIKSLRIKSIVALPTFVIVDSNCNILTQKIGVQNIEEFITFLYDFKE